MKKILFTATGAASFAVISYFLVEVFASWHGPRYIESDADINNALILALVFMLFCTLAGGVVGFKWANRLNRRRTRPDA